MAKKTVKLLGSAGAVVLATGLSNQVMASEQVETQPVNATTVQASPLVDTNQDQVSKAEVDQAKAELDQAEKEVATQQQTINQLKAEMAQATQEADKATQQLKAAETAMQENTGQQVAAAQTVVANAEKAVASASQEVETAQSALPQAQQVVADQEQVHASSTVALETAKAELDVAQQQVKDAQAVLDGTGQAQLTATIQTAKDDIARLTSEETRVKAELEQSKQADANRQATVASAEQAVKAAETKVNDQQNRLDEATLTANQAAKALATAKEAEAASQRLDHIAITPSYVANLRDYMATNSPTAFNNLLGMVESSKAQNAYKDRPEEERISFPTNSIPRDIRTELSLYASDLVNQVRQYFGTMPTVVTPSALDFADRVADNYVADNWSFQQTVADGHNVQGIIRAARPYNLMEGQYYENMYTISDAEPNMTLNAARRMIHDAVIGFMFNDNEYEHAKSISGLLWDKQTEGTYLGIDFSSRTTAHTVHFLTVETVVIQQGSTFDKTAIANPNAPANATSNLNKAQTAHNEAQKALADEQAKLEAAQQEVTRAQDHLKQALAPSNTANLETSHQQIQIQLTAAQQKLADAEATLANISASTVDKQEALTKAQQALQTKQASLDQVQAQWNQSQDRLNDLQHNLTQARDRVNAAENKKQAAETVLNSARARVVALQTRAEDNQKAAASARVALAEALAKLKDKTEASLKANQVLDELIKVKNSKSERYNELLRAYSASQQSEQTNQLISQTLNQLQQPKDSEDDQASKNSQVQHQQLVHRPREDQTTQTIPTSQTATSGAKALPQTGTEDSNLAVIGLMATSLAMVLAHRKKETE